MASRPKARRQRAPVDVFRYRDYREFLAAYYRHKKARGFSYRSFARAAGLGAPNYLKLVIDGKRNLSEEMAARFAAACQLNDDAVEYFKTLVAFNQATSDEQRNELHDKLSCFARFRSSQRLDLAEKEYHSAWYMPAIRELAACPGFRDDAGWIASVLRPNITEKQAAKALEVLQQLGLLERDEQGRLVQGSRAVTTGPQARGLYIRNFHAEMMQRATESMREVPAAERDITALTLTASPATLQRVRELVSELRAELVALCDADPHPSRVVQLNYQLFPLSHETLPVSAAPPAGARTPLSRTRKNKESTQ